MNDHEPTFSEIADAVIDKEEAFAANQANWDERAGIHAGSDFYGIKALIEDPAMSTDVVAPDVAVMMRHLPGGSLQGLDLIHLQCHIGSDTLALARTGARVTGVDFSPASLAAARDIARRADADIRYVESNIEHAAQAVGEQFDVVYTSIGAICWLPDLDVWAANVAALLRPGGLFYIRDSHPMLHTLDDMGHSPFTVTSRYFANSSTQGFDDYQTYTGGESASLQNTRSYDWPHAMSETVQALLDAGLRLRLLDEGRSLPWEALPQMRREGDNEDYVLDPPWDERIPLTFTIIATKD
ncbi:MAG: class I SAM-dependent methyltransferase [Ornithinimicrobium sp.]